MSQKEIRTLKSIESLRRRVLTARMEGSPVFVSNALEYEILAEALQALGDLININTIMEEVRYGG